MFHGIQRLSCSKTATILFFLSFSFFSVWSLEKLSNKIYDMRDLYNQCVEENIPFSETVGTG